MKFVRIKHNRIWMFVLLALIAVCTLGGLFLMEKTTVSAAEPVQLDDTSASLFLPESYEQYLKLGISPLPKGMICTFSTAKRKMPSIINLRMGRKFPRYNFPPRNGCIFQMQVSIFMNFYSLISTLLRQANSIRRLRRF